MRSALPGGVPVGISLDIHPIRAACEDALEAAAAVDAEQNRIFMLVEEPLCAIKPGLAAGELTQLARTVFSAVHGVVSLGLEQKLSEIPPRRLREQTAGIVTAIAHGLRI